MGLSDFVTKRGQNSLPGWTGVDQQHEDDRNELAYRVALTMLPINATVQRELLERAGSATNVYDFRHKINDLIPDATHHLQTVLDMLDHKLQRAADELDYCNRMNIKALAYDDACYPRRLCEIPDAPTILYYKGAANLNAPHCVSVVGTRKCTEYGRDMCDMFIDELRRLVPDVIVFSGLAFGIDVTAHRRCLKCGVSTVGVVAHGLDTLYPVAHRAEAEAMLQNGAIITEYYSHTPINKNNFLARNCIIAGCSDATVVVQSAEHGGSLHTARLSNDYGRDVYTFPGRANEESCYGCIDLVYNNEATLIRSARQFVERQGWEVVQTSEGSDSGAIQTNLFAFDDERKMKILKLLRSAGDALRLEQIAARAALSNAEAMSILVEMEMDSVVETCGNGRYRLEKEYR